jgi:quercetin 2,3-dioxygenase
VITVRRAPERGSANHGWLDTRHTFSFADYYDPQHMGFRALRVINEDRVAPRAGFATHPHRDIEILTYVLDGALAHRDSMGNGSVIHPGELQRMTAGTGVAHSEYNASDAEPVHFLQIWIQPERLGLAPSYQQATFPVEDRTGRLRLVASRDGRDCSLTIHQDLAIYAAVLPAGQQVDQPIADGRHIWVQMARGSARINGQEVSAGDGVALTETAKVSLVGVDGAELLLFDLA